MVRPTKPSDIKVDIPGQKTSRKLLRPDIEDRYRTEAPKHKKPPVEKSKSPLTSPRSSLTNKNTIEKFKPFSPTIPKLGKFSSLQTTDTGVPKKPSVPKTGSQTKSPESTAPKKTKKHSTKKVEKKDSPLFRLLHENDKTGNPSDDSKMISRQSKFGRIISGAKKIKKSSLKKTSKTGSKNLSFNLKPTTDSVVSLTTHFRMPFLHNDPPTARKTTPKKRKTTIQKKGSKSKGDQEDTTKNKTKRKSKLNKKVDRVLSSDSVPIFSLRKLKHNDSFVISARKLQKSSSERRNHKPDRLKLNVSTSITKSKQTDSLPLKPCLKKSLEGENKTMDFIKKEGNFRLPEMLQIV